MRTLPALMISGLILTPMMTTGQACAQQYLSPGYIFSEIQQGMGFYKVPEAPGFVRQSRPDPSTLDYQSLKPAPRGFHSEASMPASKLEAEVPAIAELEAARARNQARAAAAGASQPKAPTKTQAVSGDVDPRPMTWNPWETD